MRPNLYQKRYLNGRNPNRTIAAAVAQTWGHRNALLHSGLSHYLIEAYKSLRITSGIITTAGYGMLPYHQMAHPLGTVNALSSKNETLFCSLLGLRLESVSANLKDSEQQRLLPFDER